VDRTKVSSERLQKVLPDALAAIHGVIERHRVTEEEWSAVLAFLTEVGKHLQRRDATMRTCVGAGEWSDVPGPRGDRALRTYLYKHYVNRPKTVLDVSNLRSHNGV